MDVIQLEIRDNYYFIFFIKRIAFFVTEITMILRKKVFFLKKRNCILLERRD